MTFFVYLESAHASNAKTEAEAIEEAKGALVERIQKDEAEWLVEEESLSERAHRLADEAVQGGEDYE